VTPATLALLAVIAIADPLTSRIEDANTAAQALQGQLDGVWTLRDRQGRILDVFQMSDAPGSPADVQGACLTMAGAIVPAEFVRIGDHRLRVRIDGVTPDIAFTQTGGVWRGRLADHAAITLTHGLATPRPPV